MEEEKDANVCIILPGLDSLGMYQLYCTGPFWKTNTQPCSSKKVCQKFCQMYIDG